MSRPLARVPEVASCLKLFAAGLYIDPKRLECIPPEFDGSANTRFLMAQDGAIDEVSSNETD